jgi:hypothetical protein
MAAHVASEPADHWGLPAGRRAGAGAPRRASRSPARSIRRAAASCSGMSWRVPGGAPAGSQPPVDAACAAGGGVLVVPGGEADHVAGDPGVQPEWPGGGLGGGGHEVVPWAPARGRGISPRSRRPCHSC